MTIWLLSLVMALIILLTIANRQVFLFCAVHMFVVHSREFVAFVFICLSVSQLCICLLKATAGNDNGDKVDGDDNDRVVAMSGVNDTAADNDLYGDQLKATAGNDNGDNVDGDDNDDSGEKCKSASVFVLCCSYVCCPFKRVRSICLYMFVCLSAVHLFVEGDCWQ